MKIVILATKSLSSNFLINNLSKGHKINVIFENKVPKKTFWKNRLKRVGPVKVIGQISFLLLALLFERIFKKKIINLIGQENLSINKNSNISTSFVESVNSNNSIDKIKLENPDLIILNGTRIISNKVLSSIDSLFINTHCGITPKYRGVHGGYWALYNNDLENYGVTIHKVDQGIDTGDILFQQKIEYDSGDNYFTYPIKQYFAALPLILKVIEKVSAGEKLTSFERSDLQSNLWYHPTIFEYLFGIFFKGVK